MMAHKTLKILFILICITFVNTAWANLMLAPQRIVFEDRQRSASVSLINTANKPTTYRLYWVQKKQGKDGKYIDLPNDSNEIPRASSMIRFSPRQVTLGAGESQTVRISLRRKKNMNAGEYRSHLLFQALPGKEAPSPEPERGSRIKLNLLLGFSIPVIIRQGKPNVKVNISDVNFSKIVDKGKSYYGTTISLTRSGPHTALGMLKIMWKPHNRSSFTQIGLLNNVALYPESTIVNYYIGFNNFKPLSGRIKVEYIGKKEYEGKIFDTAEVSATPKDFKYQKLN